MNDDHASLQAVHQLALRFRCAGDAQARLIGILSLPRVPGPRGVLIVTGGYVYRGTALPELAGQYLYSDYCSWRCCSTACLP